MYGCGTAGRPSLWPRCEYSADPPPGYAGSNPKETDEAPDASFRPARMQDLKKGRRIQPGGYFSRRFPPRYQYMAQKRNGGRPYPSGRRFPGCRSFAVAEPKPPFSLKEPEAAAATAPVSMTDVHRIDFRYERNALLTLARMWFTAAKDVAGERVFAGSYGAS